MPDDDGPPPTKARDAVVSSLALLALAAISGVIGWGLLRMGAAWSEEQRVYGVGISRHRGETRYESTGWYAAGFAALLVAGLLALAGVRTLVRLALHRPLLRDGDFPDPPAPGKYGADRDDGA